MSGYIYAEHAADGADAPLVFVFHGTGGDETQLLGLGRQLLPDAHVIAPRGDVSEGGALRYFRRTGEGVYDMADLALRTRAMADFIAERRAARPGAPTIGLGYSNGANILCSTLIEDPALFDAAILMHPLIPFTPPPRPALAGRRVLITAGRRDPICPPEASEALAAYLSAQGVETHLAWHPGGHEVREEELRAAADFLAPYRNRGA